MGVCRESRVTAPFELSVQFNFLLSEHIQLIYSCIWITKFLIVVFKYRLNFRSVFSYLIIINLFFYAKLPLWRCCNNENVLHLSVPVQKSSSSHQHLKLLARTASPLWEPMTTAISHGHWILHSHTIRDLFKFNRSPECGTGTSYLGSKRLLLWVLI